MCSTLLAIGDLHLGTRCSGVPEAVFDWGVDPGDLTPAATLASCVDLAIDKGVNAVLFAGDVVESTNARFEAMVPLETNVRRLLEADIAVIAVAGNHDVEALPRLAALVEGFRLLGEGGTWESMVITSAATPVAEIVGWSFGERHVRQSPVAELLANPLERMAADIPRIGLLHADLDASGGPYAPVRKTELEDTGYDAWLLGHIHKPSLAKTPERPAGYLGSVAPLDPTESGPHGPWLVRISQGARVHAEQIPLAPLRWEHLSISIDGLAHIDDVADRLLAETAVVQRRIAEEGHAPRVLGLKAGLTGSSPCHSDVVQRIASGEWRGLGRLVEGTAVFFREIVPQMTPRYDLALLAGGDDPAALLARRLMALDKGGEEASALLEAARGAMTDLACHDHWTPVSHHRNARDPLDDELLTDMLLRAGFEALGQMVSSKLEDDSP